MFVNIQKRLSDKRKRPELRTLSEVEKISIREKKMGGRGWGEWGKKELTSTDNMERSRLPYNTFNELHSQEFYD